MAVAPNLILLTFLAYSPDAQRLVKPNIAMTSEGAREAASMIALGVTDGSEAI